MDLGSQKKANLILHQLTFFVCRAGYIAGSMHIPVCAELIGNIKRAVFQYNVVIDLKKREYLTNNMNMIMLKRFRKSNFSDESKKRQAGENTGLSCQVAGAGLEPTTFGL